MRKRSSIASGVILIFVGTLLLALQFLPDDVTARLDFARQWPLILVGVGALFFFGAVGGTPGMAVPGAIVGGLGAMMYVQTATDSWDSWSYAWALILVFIGVGTILARGLEGKWRRGWSEGGRLTILGLALFGIFGAFLGAWPGLNRDLLWPAALIFLGLLLLSRNILPRS